MRENGCECLCVLALTLKPKQNSDVPLLTLSSTSVQRLNTYANVGTGNETSTLMRQPAGHGGLSRGCVAASASGARFGPASGGCLGLHGVCVRIYRTLCSLQVQVHKHTNKYIRDSQQRHWQGSTVFPKPLLAVATVRGGQ